MPIRINLLSEALIEEDFRRRDPVKRTIYGGSFVVALSLVWFSSTWLEGVVDKQKLSSAEADMEAHTNEYAQVQSNLKRTADVQKRIDALNQLASARFLQGNLMNALQQTYVPNVQLLHLRVHQEYSATAATPAKNGSPGHPACATEHVTVVMDAKDCSPNPGDQVQNFKDALLKQDYFNASIGTNGIRLSGLSALQTPTEGKPFVMFTLECKFADRP